MFDGFATDRLTVADGVELYVRHGGSGPAVLLLHGHPRTHATWHRVAPLLADRYTVVCPDLRGYGRSSKPPTDSRHRPYSKRVMAADLVALMISLGHSRYAVVGHDRGAYVGFRLALDHPAHVDRLAVLDAVPIGDALARADAHFAQRWWHWFFLGQTAKPAERVINADPDAWYRVRTDHMDPDAEADLRAALHDPATVHAMCEDYRAGLGIDRDADDADRAHGRRLGCPLLFGWATGDDLGDIYGNPAAIWRDWAPLMTEVRFDCGHHIAEERPARLAAEIAGFVPRPARA